MTAFDKPWRIQEPIEDEFESHICQRLGCHTDQLVAVNSPHSALQLLVCKPCRWARKRWDEMNQAGASRSYAARLTDRSNHVLSVPQSVE